MDRNHTCNTHTRKQYTLSSRSTDADRERASERESVKTVGFSHITRSKSIICWHCAIVWGGCTRRESGSIYNMIWMALCVGVEGHRRVSRRIGHTWAVYLPNYAHLAPLCRVWCDCVAPGGGGEAKTPSIIQQVVLRFLAFRPFRSLVAKMLIYKTLNTPTVSRDVHDCHFGQRQPGNPSPVAHSIFRTHARRCHSHTL